MKWAIINWMCVRILFDANTKAYARMNREKISIESEGSQNV